MPQSDLLATQQHNTQQYEDEMQVLKGTYQGVTHNKCASQEVSLNTEEEIQMKDWVALWWSGKRTVHGGHETVLLYYWIITEDYTKITDFNQF